MAPEDVPGIDVPEPSELYELGRRAVDVGSRIEDDDRLGGRWEHRADGGPGQPGMEPQDERRRGHLRAGVPGGDEGVGGALSLQPQADGHRRIGLAAHRDGGLVRHLDDLVGIDQDEPLGGGADERRRVDQLAFEDGPHDGGPPDQLELVGRIELLERQQGRRDRGLRGVVAPHRVQGDPRHDQALRAATRCAPA